MQWARAFIISLVALSLTARCTGETCRAHIKGGCARGWRQWGDFCYKGSEMTYINWKDANQDCIRMGAVMVAPQSDEEYHFIVSVMNPNWINCKYNQQDGWECEGDTAAHKYRKWDEGEPNQMDIGHHCVVQRGFQAGWNTVICTELGVFKPTTCKRRAAPTLYF